MFNKKIVITGLGAISGLGHNVEQNWKNLCAGKSGVSKLSDDSRFEDNLPFDFPVNIASYVKDFEISEDLLSAREKDRFDTFTHYALHSTKEALQHSKVIPGETYAKERIGCILGVGMGGFPLLEKEHEKFIKGSRPRTSPFFIPAVIPNMSSGMVGIKFDIRGVNYSISSACASSGHAIEAGILQILSGAQDLMVVGGVEAVITKLTTGGFHSMKALSKREVTPDKASCPFSSERDGFVMGEGAGVLILEEKENALKRGADILAEVSGFGSSCDAFHITAPHEDGRGATQSMACALKNANLSPDQIDYINAHGTSTPIGDKLETKAIKNVFKESASKLNVSSTKSMTGHLLGAAAGLESVITVLSLVHQEIPPTINLNTPDPDCDLNYTANQSVKKEIQYALNNAFGFGGTNSSLIFGKPS